MLSIRSRVSKSFALVLFVTLAFAEAQARPSSHPILTLTNTEKAQIVRSVLLKELANRKWHGVRTVLLLNNENITPECLPRISNLRFELLDQTQIQIDVAEGEAISYLFIGTIESKGSSVRVSFGQHHESRRSSSGSGTIYEYRKVAGKWSG